VFPATFDDNCVLCACPALYSISNSSSAFHQFARKTDDSVTALIVFAPRLGGSSYRAVSPKGWREHLPCSCSLLNSDVLFQKCNPARPSVPFTQMRSATRNFLPRFRRYVILIWRNYKSGKVTTISFLECFSSQNPQLQTNPHPRQGSLRATLVHSFPS